MSKTLDEVIESLPLELQVAAEARGRELIREEMTLQALRKQLELTQESMAERLDIRQGNISKVENRSDMLISTLRSYVEAMGGGRLSWWRACRVALLSPWMGSPIAPLAASNSASARRGAGIKFWSPAKLRYDIAPFRIPQSGDFP
uniref:helix-turn-helix domain-containing protein n=1 Tax=Pseudomonas sp. P1B16 TaxID=2986074 RepID=UPI002A2402DB|nr:helix-turn-helix transcriptional regulator [Pseudomonas sp. P1B16]